MQSSIPPSAWSPSPVPRPAPLQSDARPVMVLAVGDADVQQYEMPAFTRMVARTTADVITLLSRERPAVVVLDLDAPGLDALAICHAASAHAATSVLVTMSSPAAAPAVLKAGCHAVLLKPFAPNLLAARLGRLVRERTQQLRLRAARGAMPSPHAGTNRSWSSVECPHCRTPNATSFEFSSHRRMWFACLACDQVWLGARQE